MLISQDIALYSFNFWCGGASAAQRMTFEELDAIEEWLRDSYGEDYVFEATEINDFFWFEDETWLEIIGQDEKFWNRPVAPSGKHWDNETKEGWAKA